MEQYLMAIDAGTGSVRAVLFDTSGRQIGAVSREWIHKEDPRYPGSMDFDWTGGWQKTVDCIRQVIAESGVSADDIVAVATTCMREGIVLYDKNGEELFACANVDARADAEADALANDDPGLEQKLYALSGQSFALDALPRLVWVKNHRPDLYEKTDKLGMFNDWLIKKLTGILAVEPSNGSTTGLMELKSGTFLPSILEDAGLRSDILPDVVQPGSVIGTVTPQAAEETGLSTATKVVVGGGDAQLGCIGVGAVGNGDAAVFGGSFWQYECNTDRLLMDKKARVRVNCHAVPGLWQYEALAFQPGLVMRWFRDAFCEEEKRIAAEKGTDVYDIMNERAKAVPAGSNGMLCAFSDVMDFLAWRHASPTFSGFSLDPERFNKVTFYRSILENAAILTRAHMHLVSESTGRFPDSVTFASGASKSPLWSSILADALGLPVAVPVVKEATALGAAILAGVGAGIYDDIASAAKNLVQIERTFPPDKENMAVYDSLFERWNAWYRVQLKAADEGLAPHMWKAPGYKI